MTNPLNLKPYTVTEKRDDHRNLITTVREDDKVIISTDYIDPDRLTNLLNAAYRKGRASAPSDFVAIGQRAEHLNDRFKYVWYGTPIEGATVYVKRSDLRPDSAHLALVPNPPTIKP